ncbi:CPBP family intramembrane glutamic endopeptidase [Aquimarina sp. 2201CG1-2-11]|uniref:CPBP family intramembrane glutamic endopeptidase n=1 Tax=Aquimarina discodermiae TaxID=3231043 RepID=UPI0034623F71
MNIVQFVKKETKEILGFAKKPIQYKEQDPFKVNLKRLGIVLGIDFILLNIITPFFGVLSSMGLEEVFENHEIVKMLTQFPIWVTLFLAIIIVPIIEELVFRFPLKYRQWIFNILIPVYIICIGCFFIDFNSPTNSITAVGFMLISLIVFGVYNRRITASIARIWNQKFKLVFYSTALLFALVHLTNYQLSLTVILVVPILILPQFIGGILIGYIRLRSGFIWGILLHALNNAILLVPIALGISKAFTTLDIKNDAYSLQVQKTTAKEIYATKTALSTDSIVIKNRSFKQCLALLLDKEEKYIKFDNSFSSFGMPELKAKIPLDIYYYTISNKGKGNTKKHVLDELQKAYNFKIIKENQKIDVLKLSTIDKGYKLSKYSTTDSSHDSSINITDTHFIYQNVTITGIIKSLNKDGNIEKTIVTDIEDAIRYDLTIPKTGIKNLKKYLDDTYGLRLIETKQEIEILELEFD